MRVDLTRAGYLEPQRNGAEAASRHTRRVYDIVAPLYPLSSRLFHSRAHRAAVSALNVPNGARVLEIATGSGEMLNRLVKANPDGQTIGIDLSPNMAARSQANARERFASSCVHCQAADVRRLPFASESFDAVVCCYLFELLPEGEVPKSLAEVRRVLRPGGQLVTILVGQNKTSFNSLYKICTKVAPAFWGRQVGTKVVGLLGTQGYTINTDRHVGQIYYSSRIISATRL
ncbi:MAG: Methyltransferase type 11 [Bryobacterales bacterium]|nr:Methyltransferase type 11 [Bryobacterales bacterium]